MGGELGDLSELGLGLEKVVVVVVVVVAAGLTPAVELAAGWLAGARSGCAFELGPGLRCVLLGPASGTSSQEGVS